MSALSSRRDDLKAALIAAGLTNAHSTVPEKASPPITFVAPGNPYLDLDGAPFGSANVHHRVIVVAGKGVNEKQADELDDMVTSAVGAVGDLVDTFEVDEPGTVSLNSQTYLGTVIRTKTLIRLEE